MVIYMLAWSSILARLINSCKSHLLHAQPYLDNVRILKADTPLPKFVCPKMTEQGHPGTWVPSGKLLEL